MNLCLTTRWRCGRGRSALRAFAPCHALRSLLSTLATPFASLRTAGASPLGRAGRCSLGGPGCGQRDGGWRLAAGRDGVTAGVGWGRGWWLACHAGAKACGRQCAARRLASKSGHAGSITLGCLQMQRHTNHAHTVGAMFERSIVVCRPRAVGMQHLFFSLAYGQASPPDGPAQLCVVGCSDGRYNACFRTSSRGLDRDGMCGF